MSTADPRHGTLPGYNQDGCRCGECSEARRRYDMVRRPALARGSRASKTPVHYPSEEDWYPRARCRGMGPEVFFISADDHANPRSMKKAAGEAVAICQLCPVRQPCLAENIDERFGIWGGTTPETRLKMRRQERRVG